jgi:hypothetical protein
MPQSALGRYHLRALPFSAEDFARTCLVRILPRSRYRLAGQTDARFQSFASNTTRIAYRQQGGNPSFLLFSGEGQNPHGAAMAAATWAEANWRPNAIQRRVRPGVVVVHVAPGNQLTPAGPVAGAVVPAAVWTVDSATGKVDTTGKPPGSPPASEIGRAATALMRGVTPPSLGELDLAEKGVMQLRTADTSPLLGYAVRAMLFIFVFRYGLGGLVGLLALPAVLSGGLHGGLVVLQLVLSVVILAGTVFGVLLVFNIRGFAYTAPGFSSSTPSVRTLAWSGYLAAMIGLAVVYDGVIPALERQTPANTPAPQYAHVSATADDDASEVYVQIGGDLTVDLSKWPSSEWSGVVFKTSNPSVLSLDVKPSAGAPPIAKFTAHQTGVARVDASTADGTYTFQLRVDVGPPPS